MGISLSRPNDGVKRDDTAAFECWRDLSTNCGNRVPASCDYPGSIAKLFWQAFEAVQADCDEKFRRQCQGRAPLRAAGAHGQTRERYAGKDPSASDRAAIGDRRPGLPEGLPVFLLPPPKHPGSKTTITFPAPESVFVRRVAPELSLPAIALYA
jgi:hypothetical protein